MVRPATGGLGPPTVNIRPAPSVNFSGTAAMGQVIQSAGEVFFGVAGQFAGMAAREDRRQARIAGATQALDATDDKNNPVFVNREEFTSRDAAFNRAAEANFVLRINTAIQKKLNATLREHRDNPERIQSTMGSFARGLRSSVPPQLRGVFDQQVFQATSPHVTAGFERRRRATIQTGLATLNDSARAALNQVQENAKLTTGRELASARARASLVNIFSTQITAIDQMVDGVNFTQGQADIAKRDFTRQFAMRLLMGQFQTTNNKVKMLKQTNSGRLRIAVPEIDEKGQVALVNKPIGKLLSPNEINQLTAFMQRGITIQKFGIGTGAATVKQDIASINQAMRNATDISADARLSMLRRATQTGQKALASMQTALFNFDFIANFRALPVARQREEIAKQETQIANLKDGGPALAMAQDRLDLSRKIVQETSNAVNNGRAFSTLQNQGFVARVPLIFSGNTTFQDQATGTERTIDAAESLRLRGIMQTLASDHFGRPVPFFDKSDVDRMNSSFMNGTQPERNAMMNTLATIPEGQRGSAFAQIAKANPILAQAVSLHAVGHPDVARNLIAGQQLRQQGLVKTNFGEIDVELLPNVSNLFVALPSGSLDPDGRSQKSIVEATKSMYAFLAARDGAQGETTPDSDRVKEAMNLVTGGVMTINGQRSVVWTYGMDPRDAEDQWKRVTEVDLQKAAGGLPVYMRGSKSVKVPLKRVIEDGQLQSIGQGRYLLLLPNTQGNMFPATNSNGTGRYIIDMSRIDADLAERTRVRPKTNILDVPN